MTDQKEEVIEEAKAEEICKEEEEKEAPVVITKEEEQPPKVTEEEKERETTSSEHTELVKDKPLEGEEENNQATVSSEAVKYDATAPTLSYTEGQSAQYPADYYQAPSENKVADAPSTPVEEPNRRLHASNLPFRFREPDLKALFEVHGEVEEVEIIYNERGSKGFGFISFRDSEAAEAARKALSGHHIDGRRMECNWATRRNNDKVGNTGVKKWGPPGLGGHPGAAPMNYAYGAYPYVNYAYVYPGATAGYYNAPPTYQGYYDASQAPYPAANPQPAPVSPYANYNTADPAYAQWYAQYYAAQAAGTGAQGTSGGTPGKSPANNRYQPY